MNINTFHTIIDATIEKLKTAAKATPILITSCKSGDDFELVVVEAVKSVIKDLGIDAIVHHTPGGHAFPDIIIEAVNGSKYGIEVKSSSAKKANGWKINGNSVLGSTRDPDVIETFIIFGKTAKAALEFKARKYEECVANVVVTHSPRYFIDMDLATGETFFEKSKINYQTLITDKDPIGLITTYFQKEGHKAWWLSDSTPAAVRMFIDLPIEEQSKLIGYGFAHFPELFQRNRTKYKRFALWLVTELSIVNPSLRDCFSASGQADLELNGTSYTCLPKTFERLYEIKPYFIEALDQSDPSSLQEDWNSETTPKGNLKSKVNAWIEILASNVNEKQLPEGVKAIKLLHDIFPEYID